MVTVGASVWGCGRAPQYGLAGKWEVIGIFLPGWGSCLFWCDTISRSFPGLTNVFPRLALLCPHLGPSLILFCSLASVPPKREERWQRGAEGSCSGPAGRRKERFWREQNVPSKTRPAPPPARWGLLPSTKPTACRRAEFRQGACLRAKAVLTALWLTARTDPLSPGKCPVPRGSSAARAAAEPRATSPAPCRVTLSPQLSSAPLQPPPWSPNLSPCRPASPWGSSSVFVFITDIHLGKAGKGQAPAVVCLPALSREPLPSA